MLGSAFYLYGLTGPTGTSFSVSLEGNSTNHSSYAATPTPRSLLYSLTNLTEDSFHSLRVTNLGALQAGEGNTLTIDSAKVEVALAPVGYDLSAATCVTETEFAVVGLR